MKMLNFYLKLLNMIDINLNFMKIQKLYFKRTSNKKVKKGLIFIIKILNLINKVEKNLK